MWCISRAILATFTRLPWLSIHKRPSDNLLAGKSAEAEARAAEESAARLLLHQNELAAAQSSCEELRAASLSLQEQLRYPDIQSWAGTRSWTLSLLYTVTLLSI